MRLAADGAIAHRARCKTTHNVFGTFNLFNGHGLLAHFLSGLDTKEAADSFQFFILLVNVAGIFLVFFRGVSAHRMLQARNSFRRPNMSFATHALRIVTANIE